MTNLKWYRGSIIDGRLDSAPLVTGSRGSIQRTLTSVGSASVEVDANALEAAQAANWRDTFMPGMTIMALADTDEPWDSPKAILYAGIVNTVSGNVGGSIDINLMEVGEYPKERLLIDLWSADMLGNPRSTISISGGSQRDIAIKLLGRAFSAAGIPSGMTTVPGCVEIPSPGEGSSTKVMRLRTDGITYDEALEELHENHGVEYIFTPKFTDSSRGYVKFVVTVGNPTISPAPVTLDLSPYETSRISGLSNTLDGREIYSKVYLSSKAGDPVLKTGSDLIGGAVPFTTFPLLKERFVTLENETDEPTLRANLALRLANAGKATLTGAVTVEEYFNPERWATALGAIVSVTAHTGALGQGYGSEFRVIGMTHTPGTGTVELDIVPEGIKYPRIPNLGIGDTIGNGINGGGGGYGSGGFGNNPPLRSPDYKDNWTGLNPPLDMDGVLTNPWAPEGPAVDDISQSETNLPWALTPNTFSPVINGEVVSVTETNLIIRINSNGIDLLQSGGTLHDAIDVGTPRGPMGSIVIGELNSRPFIESDMRRKTFTVSKAVILDSLGALGSKTWASGEAPTSIRMHTYYHTTGSSTDSYLPINVQADRTDSLTGVKHVWNWMVIVKLPDPTSNSSTVINPQAAEVSAIPGYYNIQNGELEPWGGAVGIDRVNNRLFVLVDLNSRVDSVGIGYWERVRAYDLTTGDFLYSIPLGGIEYELANSNQIICEGNIIAITSLTTNGVRVKMGVLSDSVDAITLTEVEIPLEWQDIPYGAFLIFFISGGRLCAYTYDPEFRGASPGTYNPYLFSYDYANQQWFGNDLELPLTVFPHTSLVAVDGNRLYGPNWYAEYNPNNDKVKP